MFYIADHAICKQGQFYFLSNLGASDFFSLLIAVDTTYCACWIEVVRVDILMFLIFAGESFSLL